MPEPILSLLIELQRLKRLDRTGWILRGLPNGTESVAAHSFGVGVTAMVLADMMRREAIKLDVEKILRMSLLHDWAETRVGDMPRTASQFFGVDVRKRAEKAAFQEIVESVDADDKLYQKLHDEYEERSSLEAKVVKAADVIDLLVEALALERAGARGLDEFWEVASDADFRLESPAREVVEQVLQSLLEARREILDVKR
ncbi:MAG TPA: HD family hydrolase [Pyrinomonadaceae bacterium]|nr:HD family hydrolase [Pyrinomonadaceae bacterium]